MWRIFHLLQMIRGWQCGFLLSERFPTQFQTDVRLFDMIVRKSDIIFSTYMYMYLENSIKSMERKRRGCSEKLIVTGENTKKPPPVYLDLVW
jgi:hypothetical protein